MDNKTFFALAQQRQGLNAFAALCQCHHETCQKGEPWNSELCIMAKNCAGIKAGVAYAGPVYNKESWEQRADGVKYTQSSAFRSYISVEAFLVDYEAKITQMYPLCVERRENFWGVFDGLLSGTYKWATDKEYMRRLAETAVRLAPEFFGAENSNAKLRTALDYAITKRMIQPENARIAGEVIGYTMSSAVAGPAKKIKICLDAGHGGKDPGACAGGITEKDIALKVAQLIGGELKMCADLCYTRTGDSYPSLADRCTKANSASADFFLSIHCNSAANVQANGFEIWTSKGQTKSDAIATVIFNKVKAAFSNATYRTDMSDGDPDKETDYYVLKNTRMPAVLVELGFISNTEDRAKLVNPDWQKKIAAVIAAAIKEAV